MTAGLDSTGWQYLLLFIAVMASWAGVPVVGTAALGAAAVAASQDKLDLATVIVVAIIAAETGGLAAMPWAAAGAGGCWSVPAGIRRAGRS